MIITSPVIIEGNLSILAGEVILSSSLRVNGSLLLLHGASLTVSMSTQTTFNFFLLLIKRCCLDELGEGGRYLLLIIHFPSVRLTLIIIILGSFTMNPSSTL